MARSGDPAGAIIALPLLYLVLTGQFGAMLDKAFPPSNSTNAKPTHTQSYVYQSTRTLNYQPSHRYEYASANYHSSQTSSQTTYLTRREPVTPYYAYNKKSLQEVICDYYTDYCKNLPEKVAGE